MLAGEDVDIAGIAAAQRIDNARWITATLAVLTALAAAVVIPLDAKPAVAVLLGVTAAGQCLAYALVRSGRSTAGILLANAALLVEHVGVVAIGGELGPVPYIAPLVILFSAATAEARWLPLALGLSMLALGLEGLSSPLNRLDQAAIVTAAMFTLVVFVVSTLHVSGTERAFQIARKRDLARERAAAAARESEKRYRLIADNTDDLIALVDSHGRALYLSPSHERLLALPIDALLGKKIDEYLSVDNQAEADQALAVTLSEGECHLELVVLGPNGKSWRLDSAMKRVGTGEDALVSIISRDVTERRTLERRLAETERLEALGRLAGSVAHDFNNLLTVIGGAAELARQDLPEDHPAGAELDAVLAAADSATKLSRQLLLFSRKQLVVKAPIQLASALEALRDVIERLVGRQVRLN